MAGEAFCCRAFFLKEALLHGSYYPYLTCRRYREQFILDNQRAFKYGAMEEFGMRDDHLEEDGEIISRRTIANSIDEGIAYRIRENGRR